MSDEFLAHALIWIVLGACLWFLLAVTGMAVSSIARYIGELFGGGKK